MPRKKIEKKYHYLYKTTNMINGKYYYGMHSTSNMNDEYLGSGKRLRYSIRKYGKENFKLEVLQFFESRDELIEAEKLLITDDIINEINCMNLMKGGRGGFPKEIQEIGRKKAIEKLKYLKDNDIEWVKNRKLIYCKANKQSIQNGNRKIKIIDWTGRKHKDETKEKIGKTNSIKQQGKNNSQYGTCWITKDNINKKIKKEQLESFIDLGWIKGRIIK